MRIFVTGASGYIGFAVSSALAAAGHRVFGLVRSHEKGKKIAAAEVEPIHGTMSDPATYLEAARTCQVLIHCAADVSSDFYKLDRITVEALLGIADSSDYPRRIVYTSGVWLYGDTGNNVVDETSKLNPPRAAAPREAGEKLVIQASKAKVSAIVIRPGCVYGASGSLTAMWFESATSEGAARIVGDGNFRWAMIHLEDLADLYLRAVESSYSGEIFNATDRSRFTVLECARAASFAAGKDGKVQTIPLAEALKTMGSYAECLTFNQHVDSSKAVRMLGWQPRHGGFVDGVTRYFTAWNATAH
jgi:nucleoside-diphosphate-sugar epimerase